MIRLYFLSPLILMLTIPFVALVPERYLQKGIRCVFVTDLRRALKRLLDLLGGALGLLSILPILIIIPILIKLDSRGRIFYVQKRIGRNRRSLERRQNYLDVTKERRGPDRREADLLGKPFTIYKFRSMVDEAEKNSGPILARKDDPRITHFGRFLRFTRLDEVPQFVNVLKGDMSIVGPRPERPEFVERLSAKLPNYPKRFRIKPGITGIAQVYLGYDTSLRDVRKKLDYDILYIRNRSVGLDLLIILKTAWVVLTGQGAR